MWLRKWIRRHNDSEKNNKKEFQERAEKFREIAEGLKVGDIKVYTDGMVPEEERKSSKRTKEDFEDREDLAKDLILTGERSGSQEGHERSLVNELLSQMDGLEAKGAEKRYLVLAATNRPWDVDIALRRAGRFDTTAFIPHPDLPARKRIFEIGLVDKPCNVDVAELAAMTDGYASAEIVDICEKAAKILLRERIKDGQPRRKITMQDFEKVLKGRRSVLTSWYPKAMREVSITEKSEIFQELIESGREYVSR